MNEWTDLEAARGVLLAAGGAMETERLIDHVGRAATRGLHRHGVDGGSLITAIRGTADIERVIAGQRGGVVTCLSAAHPHGIPLIGNPPGAVHLAVPRSRSRLRGGKRTPGIVVHNETHRIGVDPHRPWLADMPSVVNRILLCADESQAVVALDHVLNHNLVTPDEIRIPASGPGTGRARRALSRVNARSRSIMETLARLELEDAGIGPIEVGALIESVGEVDLLIDDLVAAEIDGRQHTHGEQVVKDRERDLRLTRMGYVVLRFGSGHVRARMVAPAVQAALERFGGLSRPERTPFTGWRVNAFDLDNMVAAFEDWSADRAGLH